MADQRGGSRSSSQTAFHMIVRSVCCPFPSQALKQWEVGGPASGARQETPSRSPFEALDDDDDEDDNHEGSRSHAFPGRGPGGMDGGAGRRHVKTAHVSCFGGHRVAVCCGDSKGRVMTYCSPSLGGVKGRGRS